MRRNTQQMVAAQLYLALATLEKATPAIRQTIFDELHRSIQRFATQGAKVNGIAESIETLAAFYQCDWCW